MDEREFWQFLEGLLRKGRASAVIGAIGCIDNPQQEYLQGHAILPKDYDKLGSEVIVKMGSLLFAPAGRKTKEAILMILAHQPSEVALTILTKYCLRPDEGLEYFAEMALDECAMWNE
jgi:hypothetical protein